MAAAPTFAATPRTGAAVLGGFDASFTAPTSVASLIAAGANGTKIIEVSIQGLATLAAGIVNIFLYNGSTYMLYDQQQLATTAASVTANAQRYTRIYSNLVIPTGWTLRVTHTTTGNDTNKICVTALGADY